MVRRYIRKLREKARKAEDAAKLVEDGNQESMEKNASLNEGHLHAGSPLIADHIAKLEDAKPPDLAPSLDQNASNLPRADSAPRRQTQQQPTAFTKFSELPLELRLIIWKHALPARRVLCIHGREILVRDKSIVFNDNSEKGFHLCNLPQYGLVFSTTDADINMLSACWESRHVAIKAYPIHLLSEDNSKEIRMHSDDIVVIDNLDVFLDAVNDITKSELMIFKKLSALGSIQNLSLVLTSDNADGGKSLRTLFKHPQAVLIRHVTFKSLFPSVKTITIVCDHNDPINGGSIERLVNVEKYGSDEIPRGLDGKVEYYHHTYNIIRSSFPDSATSLTRTWRLR
ncbi:hypothetical protein ONS96_013417 [Cadophora gregata f. sp. sojae]|nr:hypothetical protein ONS96_013417 [Cadophora gregata f. sp. sojae]